MLYDMYDSSTNRPFIETYNPGVDNQSISDNLSDLDIEGKLDQFSSDEFSSVTFMLESREVCEKQTTEPEAKTTAKLSVKGRLKENIDFWREIGTSNWGLKVIEQGYALPFVELPEPAYFGNHPMNEVEKRFLVQEIKNLVASGCVKECKREDLTVINPLKVAKNKEKMRMILDLRYINKHLRSCRFKYEDLRTATDLFEKDGYFFKWDYKSGYHHIDILPEHQKYLGFSMEIEGQVFFFAFTVLPFGLSTGPYIFTKVQKPLVRHWRAKGFRIFMYLDDGSGMAKDYRVCLQMSEAIQRDIKRSGFMINHEKSIWLPRQEGELLGFIIDLKEGTFRVPNHRVKNLKILLDKVTEKKIYTTAREVAKVTGSIISMSLALGAVARLWTRALYRNSSSATTWDRKIILSIEGQKEIEFWAEEFDSCHGAPIWKRAPKIDVITYSDAGEPGWGVTVCRWLG